MTAKFEEALNRNLGIAEARAVREVEVYVLTVCASDAPGLKPTSKAIGGGARPGGFHAGGLRLEAAADFLEYFLGKAVVDGTGLTGLWAADINWEMSQSELDIAVPDPEKVIKAARDLLGLELNRV